MRPLARLALLSGGRAAAAVLGALGAVLLARALTAEELGLWALALAVQGYALHLGELGLRSVATAEAGRGKAALRPLLVRYLALRLALSLAVLGAVAAGVAVLAPAAAAMVLLAVSSILAAALQIDWVALADDRAGLAAALLAVRPAAFLAALVLWPVPLTPTSVAGLFLAAWLLAAAASWLCLHRPHGPRGAGRPPAPGALLAAGAPLCVVTLLSQALLSADLLLAGAVLGAAAAGHLFIASQVATAGLVVANAAGQAALARLARHDPEGEPFARALAAEGRLVLGCGVLLSLLLLALAPPLVPRLFGPAQSPAVPVLLALLPWFLLQHATTLLQGALAAAGRSRPVLRANLLMLLVLAPALLAAAWCGSLVLIAAARGLGEAARVTALLLALPPGAARAFPGAGGLMHALRACGRFLAARGSPRTTT